MAIDSSLIDAREACTILGVSRARLFQLVNKNKLAPKGKIGSAYVFDSKEVREFSKIERPTGRPKKNPEQVLQKT